MYVCLLTISICVFEISFLFVLSITAKYDDIRLLLDDNDNDNDNDNDDDRFPKIQFPFLKS